MASDRPTAGSEAMVWACLDRVADPELDEPITEMGFVERVAVDGLGGVAVEFRLPTYWCSPNFAFLMADGIHRELGRLAWVRDVAVTLHDHMYAEEINKGVNAGRSFPDLFTELCQGEDLGEVRAKFEVKAFQRRQEAVLLGLRAEGWSDPEIVVMRLAELERLEPKGETARLQKPRYLELLKAKGLARRSDDLAFCALDGAALSAALLPAYLAELRGVRINMEFNGALCRGLRQSRYKEVVHEGGEPTLVDFLPQAPPATADRPG